MTTAPLVGPVLGHRGEHLVGISRLGISGELTELTPRQVSDATGAAAPGAELGVSVPVPTCPQPRPDRNRHRRVTLPSTCWVDRVSARPGRSRRTGHGRLPPAGISHHGIIGESETHDAEHDRTVQRRMVRDFLAGWERRDTPFILDRFTDDAVYHSIPLTPIVGKAAIRDS